MAGHKVRGRDPVNHIKFPLTNLWLLGDDATRFRVSVVAAALERGGLPANWLAICWLGEYLGSLGGN